MFAYLRDGVYCCIKVMEQKVQRKSVMMLKVLLWWVKINQNGKAVD